MSSSRLSREKKNPTKKRQKYSFQTFFFFFELQARVSESHCCFTASTRGETTGGEEALEELPGRCFFFFLSKLEEAVVSVGQDTGLYAGRTGIQMQAGKKKKKKPGGHPGVSASSGDKDLESRNTRGGAWSRDFKPWISRFLFI